MDIDEIRHPFVKDTSKLLEFIEEGYNDWRKLQRYSFLYTHNEEGYQQIKESFYNKTISGGIFIGENNNDPTIKKII